MESHLHIRQKSSQDGVAEPSHVDVVAKGADGARRGGVITAQFCDFRQLPICAIKLKVKHGVFFFAVFELAGHGRDEELHRLQVALQSPPHPPCNTVKVVKVTTQTTQPAQPTQPTKTLKDAGETTVEPTIPPCAAKLSAESAPCVLTVQPIVHPIESRYRIEIIPSPATITVRTGSTITFISSCDPSPLRFPSPPDP